MFWDPLTMVDQVAYKCQILEPGLTRWITRLGFLLGPRHPQDPLGVTK